MASDIFSNNVRIKGIQPFKKTNIIIGKTGKIEFAGKAFIAGGTTIRVENGVCTFCANFSCNTNCFISCTEKVTFGDNCLLGCYVNVRDSDGHTIILNDVEQVSLKSVEIVTKSVNEEHCIIAGYPAKVVRREIDWKR